MTEKKIALIGMPNAGKTTFLNTLTGKQLPTANRSGVTLDRVAVSSVLCGESVLWCDLPGIYDIAFLNSDSIHQEERVVFELFNTVSCDVFLNILDARHLQRQLYLTLALRPLELPLCVLLTQVEPAFQASLKSLLQDYLKCPVYCLSSSPSLNELQECRVWIAERCHDGCNAPWTLPSIPVEVLKALQPFQREGKMRQVWTALEGYSFFNNEESLSLAALQAIRPHTADEDVTLWLADRRFQALHALNESIVSHGRVKNSAGMDSRRWTQKIDAILLHRIWALPCFAGILFLFLGGSLAFGVWAQGACVDLLDGWAQNYWIRGLQQLHLSDVSMRSLGVGLSRGVETLLGFVPLLMVLNLALSFLENTGYMARVSVLLERGMKRLGLSGMSFIPLVLGLGCNVPAILSTRGLAHSRDRFLTVLMSPFMSCSARLVIYSVFAQAFFAHYQILVVLGLYLLGGVLAVLTGWLLRSNLSLKPSAPMVMELPLYLWPNMRILWARSVHLTRDFLKQSALITLPLCIGVGYLLPSFGTGATGVIHAGSWVFAPMGLNPEQWPLWIALIAGMISKELLIVTLSALYAGASNATLGAGALVQALGSTEVAMAYVIFVALYIPCVSTFSAMARVLNYRWAIFSAVWSLFLAYALAVIFYQVASWSQHPTSSAEWVFGLTFCLAAFWGVVRWVHAKPTDSLIWVGET